MSSYIAIPSCSMTGNAYEFARSSRLFRLIEDEKKSSWQHW